MESLKIYKSELIDAFETELASSHTEYDIKNYYLSNCVEVGLQFDEQGVELFTNGIHAMFDTVINFMDNYLVGKNVTMGTFWAGLYECLVAVYEETMNIIEKDEEYEEGYKYDLMLFNSTVYTAYLLIMNRVYRHLEMFDPVHITLSYINDVDEEEYHDI